MELSPMLSRVRNAPCRLAISRAAPMPFPETSASMNPHPPSINSNQSKESPPIPRAGTQFPNISRPAILAGQFAVTVWPALPGQCPDPTTAVLDFETCLWMVSSSRALSQGFWTKSDAPRAHRLYGQINAAPGGHNDHRSPHSRRTQGLQAGPDLPRPTLCRARSSDPSESDRSPHDW